MIKEYKMEQSESGRERLLKLEMDSATFLSTHLYHALQSNAPGYTEELAREAEIERLRHKLYPGWKI